MAPPIFGSAMATFFFLCLILLVLVQLRRDVRIVDRLSPGSILRSPIRRAGIVFVALLILPYLFVAYSGWGGLLILSGSGKAAIHVLISAMISYTWYRYLTWLDTFEREKFGWELAVFIAGCACTFLTFPLSDLVIEGLGLRLDGDDLNDWWFSFLGIGMVEEIVKLLPLLLLLIFTDQVDEPFDFILYASISALGFAFVENTMYLDRSDLYAVGGRVLYASVSHMFDSSVIAYSMALAHHRGKDLVPATLLGLLLAALAHGFYDYWLLAPHRPYVLTLVFFLGTIHLWVAMKTSLVNLSPNYQVHMRPRSVMFRYRIINALLAIFLFTYVMKFLLSGKAAADHLLLAQGSAMGAILLFLAISFSSYRFIPGHLTSLRPKGRLWRFLLPVVEWGEDLSGRSLLMRIPEERSKVPDYMILHRMLPLKGLLSQRVIVDDQADWYLLIPERPVPFRDAADSPLLIRPHHADDTIPEDRYVVVAVVAFKGSPAYADARVRKEQLVPIGHVHAKLI